MVFRIGKELSFPRPELGDDNGLLEVGGDLSIDRLLFADSYGIFPWYPFRDETIEWWCPMRRFVIFPSEIHISHSMRSLMNKQRYRISFNEAFSQVLDGCAEEREREEGAWLGPQMKEAYSRLHEQGFAASVEVWEGDALVGGLYGVTLGSVFYGESMFSRMPSASKLALIHLARTLQTCGGELIDCQFETPHLRTMGGRYISYAEYMRIVNPQYRCNEQLEE